MQRRIGLWLAVPLLMAGCGGSSSTKTSSSSLSGNWLISMTKTDHPTIIHTQSGFLLQNGDNITGNVVFNDAPCSGVASVNGTVSGSSVSLAVNPVGTAITLTGAVSSSQPPMSGNYTILSTGCSGSQSAPEEGAWTASQVSPLSGTISGTLMSSSGTTYQVTGKVSQGPNTGASEAPLSGTLTVTDYCFTTANILGTISGTSITMNLVNPDGTEIGQLNGTTSLDGSTVNPATYHIVPQGVGGTAPCVDGANGTAMLAIAGH